MITVLGNYVVSKVIGKLELSRKFKTTWSTTCESSRLKILLFSFIQWSSFMTAEISAVTLDENFISSECFSTAELFVGKGIRLYWSGYVYISFVTMNLIGQWNLFISTWNAMKYLLLWLQRRLSKIFFVGNNKNFQRSCLRCLWHFTFISIFKISVRPINWMNLK